MHARLAFLAFTFGLSLFYARISVSIFLCQFGRVETLCSCSGTSAELCRCTDAVCDRSRSWRLNAGGWETVSSSRGWFCKVNVHAGAGRNGWLECLRVWYRLLYRAQFSVNDDWDLGGNVWRGLSRGRVKVTLYARHQ